MQDKGRGSGFWIVSARISNSDLTNSVCGVHHEFWWCQGARSALLGDCSFLCYSVPWRGVRLVGDCRWPLSSHQPVEPLRPPRPPSKSKPTNSSILRPMSPTRPLKIVLRLLSCCSKITATSISCAVEQLIHLHEVVGEVPCHRGRSAPATHSARFCSRQMPFAPR